jgi:hypothetical protein
VDYAAAAETGGAHTKLGAERPTVFTTLVIVPLPIIKVVCIVILMVRLVLILCIFFPRRSVGRFLLSSISIAAPTPTGWTYGFVCFWLLLPITIKHDLSLLRF